MRSVQDDNITSGVCRIRLLPRQHEFRPKGGKIACIEEIASCDGIAGRGSLRGCRFQNRIDSLFFGSLVSFMYTIVAAIMFKGFKNSKEAISYHKPECYTS
jgi:hypothetical protein